MSPRVNRAQLREHAHFNGGKSVIEIEPTIRTHLAAGGSTVRSGRRCDERIEVLVFKE
jgi:hypothetical protein